MKKIFTLVSILLIHTIGLAQKNFIDQNYITVKGKAEMHIAPDEIYINILIDENDKKGGISVEKQEAKLISGLKSLGIDINQAVKVKNFNSDYQKMFLKKDDIIKTKKFELLVKNTDQLQKVFNLLEKLEVSNAHISKTNHSKIESFKKEVKVNAITAAKSKAEYLSAAINQTIGKAILINELNTNNIYGLANNVQMLESREQQGSNQYEFGNIILTESVEVYFELK